MKTLVSVKFKTRIVDADTLRVVKESPWRKNLVLDIGLNGLAQDTSQGLRARPAAAFTKCLVGDGTNPNSIASGAITFTQAAFTVTASAGFFTSAMVGGILKYGSGSGGVEYYITAFTDSTHVTVDTSATVGATVGTVWQVQQTTLQNLLFTSSTYQANANGTTFSTNTVTHQRTFIFAHQAAPYNVNEIGWNNGAAANLMGRAVLGSTDVVGTNQFYVVVLALTFSYVPGAPTAVVDVGTGVNVAGNAMVEWLSTDQVNSDGSIAGVAGVFDGISSPSVPACEIATATYTQNAGPATSQAGSPNWAGNVVGVGGTVALNYVPASRGKMQCQFVASLTTTGQTAFGVGLMSSTGRPAFDVKFTTTFALPNGPFSPTITWTATYDRTLTN
jgi:hypothetical protein